jgi:hypothetical protein
MAKVKRTVKDKPVKKPKSAKKKRNEGERGNCNTEEQARGVEGLPSKFTLDESESN